MKAITTLTVIALIFTVTSIGSVKDSTTLDVSHRARALHPGEVVVIQVKLSWLPVAIRASAFGHSHRFFPSRSGEMWLGLVGIDLDTKPGEYPVILSVITSDGQNIQSTYILTVEPKQFPTRNLNVNPSFVNPPSDVLERIQSEALQVAEIFSNSSAERQWQDGFIVPVEGPSTSSFGRRSVYNGEPRSPHTGTDFRSAHGTPIRAPNAGIVVMTADLYFSGKVVILDHGWGLYSYFAHLSEYDVIKGETVRSGQIVGKVGSSGRVTGPHLHWTVRLHEARVDPLSLVELSSNLRVDD